MNKKAQTINTYNRSALLLADKFDSLGARVSDIEETLAILNKPEPNILEIGCGNGRDAEEILKHTNNYLGIDVSEKLIDLAKKKVSKGRFEIADIETYPIPNNLDVIFAFASLIHVPKESLQKILNLAFKSLNSGGVFFMSMKHADGYVESTKEDEFGTRTYYLYSIEDIKEIAKSFIILKNKIHDLRGQKWFEIILQKP